MNKTWIKHDLANCNLANGKHIEEHACPPAANTILSWPVWIKMDHLPWSYLSESRWQVKRKHIKPCLTTMGSFISPWLKWKMGRKTFVKKIVYDGIDKCPFAGQKLLPVFTAEITYWRSSNVHDCLPMNFPSWGVPLLFLERWNPESLQRLVAAKTAFTQDLEGNTKSTHKKIKTPRFSASEAQMSIFWDKTWRWWCENLCPVWLFQTDSKVSRLGGTSPTRKKRTRFDTVDLNRHQFNTNRSSSPNDSRGSDLQMMSQNNQDTKLPQPCRDYFFGGTKRRIWPTARCSIQLHFPFSLLLTAKHLQGEEPPVVQMLRARWFCAQSKAIWRSWWLSTC